jgi:hypothetical protein
MRERAKKEMFCDSMSVPVNMRYFLLVLLFLDLMPEQQELDQGVNQRGSREQMINGNQITCHYLEINKHDLAVK